jgi:hypothetical protein
MESESEIKEWESLESQANEAMNEHSYSLAAKIYGKLLKTVENRLGEDDPNVLWVKRHYSEALIRTNQYKDADKLLDQLCMTITKIAMDQIDVFEEVLKLRIERVGQLMHGQNDFDQAMEVLKSAFENSLDVPGVDPELIKGIIDNMKIVKDSKINFQKKFQKRLEKEGQKELLMRTKTPPPSIHVPIDPSPEEHHASIEQTNNDDRLTRGKNTLSVIEPDSVYESSLQGAVSLKVPPGRPRSQSQQPRPESAFRSSSVGPKVQKPLPTSDFSDACLLDGSESDFKT